MSLPPFLIPLQPPRTALFRQDSDVLVHWWSPKLGGTRPSALFLFIPGNPGVIDFYTHFLDTIHDLDTSGTLAILAFSHVGHAPSLASRHPLSSLRSSQFGLASQLQNALNIFDAVRSTFGPSVRVVLAGHSVGAWFALQVLRLRSNAISRVFLLFPTIVQIADTPNGKRLSWLFRAPLPRVIANLANCLYYLPVQILGVLFRSYPRLALNALHSFLRSPQVIFAAMSLAHDEMINIRRLDSELLNRHSDLLWIYFAQRDDWVGQQMATILEAFGGDEARIFHDESGVQHAFCINQSEEMGKWIIKVNLEL